MRHIQIPLIALFLCAALPAASPSLHAQKLRILHSFTGGRDGGEPDAGLVLDTVGNHYGTTFEGGAHDCGVVFRMNRKGREHVVHSFGAAGDGCNPDNGDLILDAAGNLYGATAAGGESGHGSLYRITPDGAESLLYSFSGTGDGDQPTGSLALDNSGNVYGTTRYGGSTGDGVVFKVTPQGAETLLHVFGSNQDGVNPYSGLVRDNDGNLFGTTLYGGSADGGVIFKISRKQEALLYSFRGGSDGRQPEANLTFDDAGSAFGSTIYDGPKGGGTAFRLASDGSKKILHSFSEAQNGDGEAPVGTLLLDEAGSLFGVTFEGGTACRCGTVYSLAPDGTETQLHTFTGTPDGAYPGAGLVRGDRGNLYGTTVYGGANGQGTVFVLKPD